MLKAENKMLRTYLAAIAILSVLIAVVPAGVMVAQASNDRNHDDNNDDSHRIELVIMQGLQMDDETMHIVKLHLISVDPMAELTTKDSYQVVYQDKGKTSFHAKN